MFCPECEAEYREGIVECPDCEVALGESLPPLKHPERNFVPVFETADVALLPVVKSLLTSAGITFMVQGDEALGLLPVGRFGGGITVAGQGLAATIHVVEERAEEALELLAPLREEAAPDDGRDTPDT
ncbi:MAG: DUF2007 domain-containing protein [Thermoanaerobaculia bacterium]